MPHPDSGPSPTQGEPASDRSLLRRIQHGQADASTELYLRYAERLRQLAASQSAPDLARRVDPDDIVQSVFRTFFRRINLGQYSVPDGEVMWKLLLVIALNKIRATAAFHRAAKRDVRRTSDVASFDVAEQFRDESALSVLRLVIEELLAELPDAHRQIVELRIEGHKVGEIAESVQRSKRTVERVMQDFCRRLDGQIHDEDR
jgi:RNA polymerase sigma-70 factor, ECF subfamily